MTLRAEDAATLAGKITLSCKCGDENIACQRRAGASTIFCKGLYGGVSQNCSLPADQQERLGLERARKPTSCSSSVCPCIFCRLEPNRYPCGSNASVMMRGQPIGDRARVAEGLPVKEAQLAALAPGSFAPAPCGSLSRGPSATAVASSTYCHELWRPAFASRGALARQAEDKACSAQWPPERQTLEPMLPTGPPTGLSCCRPLQVMARRQLVITTHIGQIVQM